MDQLLIRKIEAEIGKITAIRLMPEQGCTSKVYRIETSEQSYIVKSCSFKEKYIAWLKSEAKVLKGLRNKTALVPTYHAFIEEEKKSHLIMSYVDGVSLTSALKQAGSLSEKKNLIRSFGEFLNRFHEREAVLSDMGGDWLEKQLTLARTYVKCGEAEGDLKLLEEIISNKPDCVQQTLIHGDCTTDNVLVVNGKVEVFIDVAGMTTGDPRYDEALAIRKFLEHPDYMEAFYQGYTRYRISKSEYEYFEEGLYMFF